MTNHYVASTAEFEAIIISDAVEAGDTIWLHAGIYTGDFTVFLFGESDNKITIRHYPNEVAIIDGSLTTGDTSTNYGNVVIREIEVTNSDANRGNEDEILAGNYRASGLNGRAPGTDLINNYVHDTGNAISHSAASINSTIYGNLCLNYGWIDSARGHGHGIYCQNWMAGSIKTIKNNIFATGFGWTIHLYGSAADNSKKETIDECVAIGSTALIGGSGSYDEMAIKGSHLWKAPLQLGYDGRQNGAINCSENHLYHIHPGWALQCKYWLTPTIDNNVFFIGGEDGNNLITVVVYPADEAGMDVPIDNNIYYNYNTSGELDRFKVDDVWCNWKEWQALGYDANGTFSLSAPTTNEVFVYENEYRDTYDKRQGIVIIWNWEELDSISVNLAGMNLTYENTYRIRNAQDPFGGADLLFKYTEKNKTSISFPMTGHDVALPIGWGTALAESIFPAFGAFLVELEGEPMTTEWKWRIYLFVRAVDATPENKAALANIYVNNDSGQTFDDEMRMFLNLTRLSVSGELPVQVFGINTVAKTAMREGFKSLLDTLTNARYAVVASVELPGYQEHELVMTNFPVTPSGQIVSWKNALKYIENEFGLVVIPPAEVYKDL